MMVDLPRPKLPSLGDWLAKKPIIQQITTVQNGLMMILFFSFMAAYSYFQTSGLERNLQIILSLVAPLVIYVIYMIWDVGNQKVSISQIPANITIQYLDQIRDEYLTFRSLKLIREGREAEGPNPALEWVYEGASDNMIKDPLNGEEYRHFLILSPLNPEETFRKYTEQIVAYRGSVFEGQGAKMVLTWLKDFQTISDFEDDEPMVPYRMFKVQWTPEIGLRELQNLGISPKNITKQSVQDALEGLDSRKAVKMGMALRDATSLNKELSEKMKDAGELMGEYIGNVVTQDGIIMQPPRFSWKSINWKTLLVAGLIGAVAYYLYLNPKGVTPA